MPITTVYTFITLSIIVRKNLSNIAAAVLVSNEITSSASRSSKHNFFFCHTMKYTPFSRIAHDVEVRQVWQDAICWLECCWKNYATNECEKLGTRVISITKNEISVCMHLYTFRYQRRKVYSYYAINRFSAYNGALEIRCLNIWSAVLCQFICCTDYSKLCQLLRIYILW
jgi:hypothetical protein